MEQTAVNTSIEAATDETLAEATVLLPPDLVEWGTRHPGGLSATVQRLMREARTLDELPDNDDYWIRLAEQGRASGYASLEETIRLIVERLAHDASLEASEQRPR